MPMRVMSAVPVRIEAVDTAIYQGRASGCSLQRGAGINRRPLSYITARAASGDNDVKA